MSGARPDMNKAAPKNARQRGAQQENEQQKALPLPGRYAILAWVAGLVVLADQVTKYLVMKNLPLYDTVSVIPGFFDLVNIRNRGAAFGFLNRHDIEWQFWLFVVATLIAAGVIFALTRTAERGQHWLVGGLGLVLGGALGNLVDRVRFRAVVDFLDFYLGQWHWPAFNVADIAICCGAALVCLSFWFGQEKKGDEAKKEARQKLDSQAPVQNKRSGA